MGNYAQCWLGNFYVGSSKNDIDSGLMGLFRQSNKQMISDSNAIMPHHLEHWLSEMKQDNTLCIVYYAAPVSVVRDRLNLLGYTLETSREAFEEYIRGELQQ